MLQRCLPSGEKKTYDGAQTVLAALGVTGEAAQALALPCRIVLCADELPDVEVADRLGWIGPRPVGAVTVPRSAVGRPCR